MALLLVVIVTGSMAAAVRPQPGRSRSGWRKQNLPKAGCTAWGTSQGAAAKAWRRSPKPRHPRTPEVRDEAIASLALFDLKLNREHPIRTLGASLLDFDSTLNRYAAIDQTGELVVREVGGDRQICRLRPKKPNSGIRFSPDGRHISVPLE